MGFTSGPARGASRRRGRARRGWGRRVSRDVRPDVDVPVLGERVGVAFRGFGRRRYRSNASGEAIDRKSVAASYSLPPIALTGLPMWCAPVFPVTGNGLLPGSGVASHAGVPVGAEMGHGCADASRIVAATRIERPIAHSARCSHLRRAPAPVFQSMFSSPAARAGGAREDAVRRVRGRTAGLGRRLRKREAGAVTAARPPGGFGASPQDPRRTRFPISGPPVFRSAGRLFYDFPVVCFTIGRYSRGSQQAVGSR